MYKYQDKVQKTTDEFIGKTDEIRKEKEDEILEF
jgi:ribosome recycling factor